MSTGQIVVDPKVLIATTRLNGAVAFRISDSDSCLNGERIINLLRLGAAVVKISCGNYPWEKMIQETCDFVKQFAIENEEIDCAITSEGKVATITRRVRPQP
ncbi:MAG: hypothetical protein G01um101420_680 [Parcubacteria group bacterium Gr01-1014_20]|nr:MAG: hypothetical protein G01um101420_680 [Parcubacteria group bacterium Gr01-1014_20]